MNPRNRIVVLLASVLVVACAGTPEADTNACHGMAEAFYFLGKNKELGLTKEDQTALVRDDPDFENNPELRRYMLGALEIVYRHPTLSAAELRAQFLAHCTVNEAGEIIPEPAWNPWTA
jgi:hypothetical protein